LERAIQDGTYLAKEEVVSDWWGGSQKNVAGGKNGPELNKTGP